MGLENVNNIDKKLILQDKYIPYMIFYIRN